MLTEEKIQQALRTVKYPGYSRDIVSFGLVHEIRINQNQVHVTLQLTSHNPEVAGQLKNASETALRQLPDASSITVDVQQPGGASQAAAQSPWSQQQKIPGVQHVVAVASGKGGVGKSTTAVNLACALRLLGARVGLLDCDIYGPSVPLMMGINERPTISGNEKLIPPESHGVKLMSMGFLLEGDSPVIWRGPMIMKTIQQFVTAVEWSPLDILLVDLPPGTGDAQLSLCQTVPLDGGVIVTTPQEASVGVVRKGIAMFEKVGVRILGLIENMSYYTTPQGERIEIFGYGGGRAEAERQKMPFLGEIPIFPEIRIAGDAGVPLVVSAPESQPAQAFLQVAQTLQKTLNPTAPQ